MMIDREKVINGLECCLPMTTRNGLADCKQCKYDRKITSKGGVTECCHDLMADALALLKAQEPRVLTLEEALKADYCWLETKGWKCGDVFTSVLRSSGYDDETGYGFIDGDERLYGVTKSAYGKHERCWSARPTEEQRKAEKWH